MVYLVIPLVGLALAGSLIAPLGTYTLTLAAFGLPHVLSEMRFVDLRFGARVSRSLAIQLGLGLVAIAALRATGIFTTLDYEVAVSLELALAVGLVLFVAPRLWALTRGASVAAFVAALAATVGIVVAPVHTLLALAVIHNVTPLGFLADLLVGWRRTVALVVGGTLFFVVPALIATGAIQSVLEVAGLYHPDASLLVSDGLDAHLGVYLHPTFHTSWWASSFFAGAVFAQCMHYVAVIIVLPALLFEGDPSTRPWLPWPRLPLFACVTACLAVTLFIGFWFDFRLSRSAYGIAAAVHAWVEYPLLLLALAGTGEAAPRCSTSDVFASKR